MNPVFEVHLEDFYHALVPYNKWTHYKDRIYHTTHELLSLLRLRGIQAVFYVLGHVAEKHTNLVEEIRSCGHQVGSHGYYHQLGEYEGDPSDTSARVWLGEPIYGYRSPYWSSTSRPNFGGGFFFRAMPYAWVLREVRRTGVFYIHPHDIDRDTPIDNVDCAYHLKLRRKIGLKHSVDKLFKLTKDIQWRKP